MEDPSASQMCSLLSGMFNQALTDRIAGLSAEETTITKRQVELKKELYGRFGDSINLES